MMGPVRQLFGLGLVVALSASIVFALTAQSRANLRAEQERANNLAEQEAALLGRAALARAAASLDGAMPEEMIWKAANRTTIEVAFQERLVTAAQNANLRVISFAPSAGPPEVTLPVMGFELELDGGHGEFATFLARIENEKPHLAYSYLWVRQQAGGEATGKAMVSVRIGVWAFVALPEQDGAP
jgi:hypothetical protein